MKWDKKSAEVTYALTRAPFFNSSEFSSILGMKQSTFTTVRNRLMDRGVMEFLWLPVPNALDMIIRGIEFGRLNYLLDKKEAVEILTENAKIEGSIFSLTTDGIDYYIQALSPSYTSMKNLFEESSIGCKRCRTKFPREHGRYFFEVNSDVVRSMYDYSKLLENLGNNRPSQRLTERDWPTVYGKSLEPVEISAPIKGILLKILENPGRSDGEIASMLGVSRQNVGRARLKLERDHLMVRAYTVNTYLLGYRIRTFFTIFFRDDPSSKKEGDLEDFLTYKRPQCWLKNGPIATFQYDFKDLSSMKSFRNALYRKGGEDLAEVKSVSISLGSASEVVQSCPKTWPNEQRGQFKNGADRSRGVVY